MSRRATDDESLRELMVAHQAGEASAFDGLYAALAPRLRAYLGSLCRDASRAEDLLQDAFLRLHRARHTYDAARPILPWAYAIARHAFLMDLRRRTRARETGLETAEVPAAFADYPCPFTADVVRSALGQLGHEHRDPVVLHHVWGFSFAEIARGLGISEGAARVRAHRAIAAMRRILGRAAP